MGRTKKSPKKLARVEEKKPDSDGSDVPEKVGETDASDASTLSKATAKGPAKTSARGK